MMWYLWLYLFTTTGLSIKTPFLDTKVKLSCWATWISLSQVQVAREGILNMTSIWGLLPQHIF